MSTTTTSQLISNIDSSKIEDLKQLSMLLSKNLNKNFKEPLDSLSRQLVQGINESSMLMIESNEKLQNQIYRNIKTLFLSRYFHSHSLVD